CEVSIDVNIAMQNNQSVSLDSLPVDVLSRILSHLSFLDRLNLRGSNRYLEDGVARSDLVLIGRQRVDISEAPVGHPSALLPGQLRLTLGSSRTLVYCGGADAPNPRRYCNIIRNAKELYVNVRNPDGKLLFYEEMTNKCLFDSLHLTIYRGSERMCNFIRTLANEKMRIVFQDNDGMDFEALRSIQRPTTIYFKWGAKLDNSLLLDLLKFGHTLESVAGMKMTNDLMLSALKIIEACAIDQLISWDMPIPFCDRFTKFMGNLRDSDGVDWKYNGTSNDKMYIHHNWSFGSVRVRETRHKPDCDRLPPNVTRLVFSKGERESIAGTHHPINYDLIDEGDEFERLRCSIS
ncbi:hypothetical protein PFISCL1PPCAC_15914, partial [Pristionchus fissidentatus]